MPFCGICLKQFKTEESRDQHVRSQPTKCGRFCSICNKEFKTRESRDQHMRSSKCERGYYANIPSKVNDVRSRNDERRQEGFRRENIKIQNSLTYKELENRVESLHNAFISLLKLYLKLRFGNHVSCIIFEFIPM